MEKMKRKKATLYKEPFFDGKLVNKIREEKGKMINKKQKNPKQERRNIRHTATPTPHRLYADHNPADFIHFGVM